jgi:hypothetical protein
LERKEGGKEERREKWRGKGKENWGEKVVGPKSFLLGLTKKFLPNSGRKSEKKLGWEGIEGKRLLCPPNRYC